MVDMNRVALYFDQQLLLYEQRIGRRVYATDFAEYLGVSDTSLSQWRTKARVPAGENLHRVAAKLGPEIYDLVEQPRLLPDVPEIQKFAERWPELSTGTRQKIMHLIEN